MQYGTTTWKLLENTRDHLKEAAPDNEFMGIARTFHVGLLRVTAAFPAISVVPESLEVVRRYSGMKYDVVRTLTVYIYVVHPSKDISQSRVMGISREVREVLQSNFWLRDNKGEETAFGLDVGNLVFSEVTEMRESFMNEAVLPIEVLSKGVFSTRTPPISISEGTNRSLMNAVEKRFRDNRNSVFGNVESWVFWKEQLVKGFPAIGVFHTGESTDKTHAGADTISRSFIVRVVTQGMTAETDKVALRQMCNISEDVLGFIHQYNTWDGTVWDTECSTITYSSDLEGGIPRYVAEIPFTCRCREEVSYA